MKSLSLILLYPFGEKKELPFCGFDFSKFGGCKVYFNIIYYFKQKELFHHE